jgi:outer membrane protein OmpA-like peptidoglycan-associated protein
MKRRILLGIASAVISLTSLTPVLAQNTDEARVVDSDAILKALTNVPKAIVLDANGRQVPPRDPSIDLQVQFDFNSATLRPNGRRQLDELAKALNNKMLIQSGFELGGHTDRVGDAQYNIRLSTDRANAVKAYLMGNHNVAAGRLQTAGFGFSRLADANRPTAAVNRRVEVRRILVLSPSNNAQPQSMSPSTAPTMQNNPTGNSGGRLVPTPKQ